MDVSNAHVGGDLHVNGMLDAKVDDWPAWPGETPTDVNLELIGEIRRMKEEIIALHNQIEFLKSITEPDT